MMILRVGVRRASILPSVTELLNFIRSGRPNFFKYTVWIVGFDSFLPPIINRWS